MSTIHRRRAIMDILTNHQDVSIAELMEEFSVSSVTIRKDLAALEKKGLLTRSRGGAHLENPSHVLPFAYRNEMHSKEKLAIAKAALELIEDGDSIIFDSGTTIMAIAKQLSGFSNLTVITNSVPIASMLSTNNNISTSLVGGILLSDHMCLVGPDAEIYLENIEAKKLFLGCSGTRNSIGITTSSPFEANIKRQMIKCAKKVIAVMDSTKFETTSVHLVAKFEQLDCIITDGRMRNREIMKTLESFNIDTIYAD
ncbi:DeoR/GlpR family DNA-binding transcription regulator [Petroclostridium sp. X23]|nr:DeoR/GlpR family DNA-binding transcription regulator [Petroclostridium sp. X23]WHH60893.1 DeoR/GlpR family DNA-binding transcription regulator [Petroclostridium sp. X23]